MRPPVPRLLLKRAVKLAIPVAAAYLVIVASLFVEAIIVGHELGGSGVAAIGLAGTFSLVLVLSFHALEIAAQAIIARRYGEGNFKAVGPCLDNALFLAFAIGLPLALGLHFGAPMIFASAESDRVRQLSIDYFQYRLIGVPFLIAVLTVIGFFNAISRPKFPAMVYAVILGLNAVLCYGMVGGKLGMPNLGIKGAGLAQSISVIVGFGMFIALMLRPAMRSTFDVLRFRGALSWKLIRNLMGLASPVFVQQFLGNFGMYLFVVINSRVPDGGVSLSASTIARHIGYITYLPSLGFGIAAATMVGQFLGARQPQRAALAGFICWQLGALFMVTVGIGFVVFWHPLVSLFLTHAAPGVTASGADDPERVAEMARMLLIVIGLYQIFEAFNTIVGKAIQGAGSTFFVMVVSVGMQWLFFLPLAWYLALPMEFGAVGAHYAFAFQLAIIAVIYLFKFRSQGWRTKEL
jgi:MATE family multidrug resistance protein